MISWSFVEICCKVKVKNIKKNFLKLTKVLGCTMIVHQQIRILQI